MNPYDPPVSETLRGTRAATPAQRNPARFLLYPLAVISLLMFAGMASRFLRDGFPSRTVEFLNAGSAVFLGLFGTTALLLAAYRLTRTTRRLTLALSVSTLCLIALSMLFEWPSSFQDVILLLASVLILVLVGLFALRAAP